MINFTQEEFDNMCEALGAMDYQCGSYFPSLKEIQEKLEPNIERDIKFALWLLETSTEPKTPEKKEARRYLMNLVYAHINITEEALG